MDSYKDTAKETKKGEGWREKCPKKREIKLRQLGEKTQRVVTPTKWPGTSHFVLFQCSANMSET